MAKTARRRSKQVLSTKICPLCGSTDIEPLYGDFFDIEDGEAHATYLCHSCDSEINYNFVFGAEQLDQLTIIGYDDVTNDKHPLSDGVITGLEYENEERKRAARAAEVVNHIDDDEADDDGYPEYYDDDDDCECADEYDEPAECACPERRDNKIVNININL